MVESSGGNTESAESDRAAADASDSEADSSTSTNAGSPASGAATNGDADLSEPPEPKLVEAGTKPWIAADKLPWEASFLHFINGNRMGYARISVLPPLLSSSKQLNVKRVDSVEFTRAGQIGRVLVTLDSLEHADGRILEFTETKKNGAQEFKTTGRLVRGVLQLKTTFADETKSESIKMPLGTWGVLGIQAVLMQEPLKPGDRRTAKIYAPSLRSVVDVDLKAGEYEETAMIDGTRLNLIPVEVVQMINEQNGSRSINWVNDAGEIQKTVTLTGTNLSWFRTTAGVVQRIEDGYTLAEEDTATYMPLAGNVEALAGAKKVTYMVDGEGVDPFEALPSEGRQVVTSITARRAALVVDASAEPAAEAPANVADLLAASPIIETGASQLEGLLESWSGDSEDSLQVATSLMKGLFDEFEHEPTISGCRTVYETTTAKAGNSLEHAILLATLLRKKEIPARVASGLLASASSKRLHLHSWTEAWIDDEWVGLDAMIGQQVGVAHIKLGDSAMAGENPFTPIIDAIELLPKLRIAVSVTE
ncbi:MAG: hypothetical protein Aurels2KO_16720 [Aureliella sp.]